MIAEKSELLNNLDKLHTTPLGAERIRNNLSLDTDDVVEWCRCRIVSPEAVIKRQGKNWYAQIGGCMITVNAHSYTIITAHKEKPEYLIREIERTEYLILNDFLYEAIFIPDGTEPPPKSIVEKDELQVYVKNFGTMPDDKCLVALVNDKIVGAVWTRIMDDYGHIDNLTPSLAISLYQEYRHLGIGKTLLEKMIGLLKGCGYRQVSLSVQKANYAVNLYRKVGFTVVSENEDEYVMVRILYGEKNEVYVDGVIEQRYWIQT